MQDEHAIMLARNAKNSVGPAVVDIAVHEHRASHGGWPSFLQNHTQAVDLTSTSTAKQDMNIAGATDLWSGRTSEEPRSLRMRSREEAALGWRVSLSELAGPLPSWLMSWRPSSELSVGNSAARSAPRLGLRLSRDPAQPVHESFCHTALNVGGMLMSWQPGASHALICKTPKKRVLLKVWLVQPEKPN